ncbi:MAG: hypothetical protein ABI172_01790 [Ginsengibacter sp.]|jgi:hypothetical protein
MITITQEDLVRYLYNETSEAKNAEIRASLQTDWDVREAFEKLLSTQHLLNEVRYSPRQQSIDRIMEYASKKQAQLHSL